MGEFNESKRSLSGMEKLSLEANRIPRDLLQRFMARNPSQLAATSLNKKEEGEDSEEIELNLGLSLGGRFGVDKSCEKKKLMRSSSVAGSIPIVRDYDAVARPPPVSYPTLIRTSSLPVETEEEWRKRTELQTLRRMEAKRRRTDKLRICRLVLLLRRLYLTAGEGITWAEVLTRKGETLLAMSETHNSELFFGFLAILVRLTPFPELGFATGDTGYGGRLV